MKKERREYNIYKKARLEAAKKNASFATVERTYEQLFISREKLLMIEQEDPKKRQTTPSPENVRDMAEAYGAPELCNHYCTQECPIGKGEPSLLYDDLDKISVRLMSALHFLDNATDKIYKILEDGIISENEKAEFEKIVETLDKMVYGAKSLKLWAEKKGLID